MSVERPHALFSVDVGIAMRGVGLGKDCRIVLHC